MDAVAIGAILTVVATVIIVVYMFIKGYKLMNEDSDKR